MAVEQMREALKSVYRSPKWKRKVDNYPDNQVVAIYKRLKLQNQV